MASSYIYDPYIHTQTVSSSVWVVEHNFGRTVNPVVYSSTGEPIIADIEETDLNTLTVRFYESGLAASKTGKVIVS